MFSVRASVWACCAVSATLLHVQTTRGPFQSEPADRSPYARKYYAKHALWQVLVVKVEGQFRNITFYFRSIPPPGAQGCPLRLASLSVVIT